MKVDKTRSKSVYYWNCHLIIENKRNRFLSLRQWARYWKEKPELKCRRCNALY